MGRLIELDPHKVLVSAHLARPEPRMEIEHIADGLRKAGLAIAPAPAPS